jgi:hypothetical protein
VRCVPARDFTVAKAVAWRSAIEENPPYQREGSIWSLDKQQLFIDSLLNGYDVPKIYLHDLRGKDPRKVYAIVDGKQRLTTIWRFLRDELPLARDYRTETANLPDVPDGTTHPGPGDVFSALHPAWQRVLRQTYLAVVLIQNATPTDIEDLFSRLNNGEPLNAAEKRNAMGGAMAELVREIGTGPFFTGYLRFGNRRLQHLDLAARLLMVEQGPVSGAALPDLRARSLDDFVRRNRRLDPVARADLRARLDDLLAFMSEVFRPADPLLASESYATIYALFVRHLRATVEPRDRSPGAVRAFLEAFHQRRLAELHKPEERQDPIMNEFSQLMQNGTIDRRGLERRLAILAGRYGEVSRGGVAAAPRAGR